MAFKRKRLRRWYTKAVFGLEPCLQATKASRILDQSITDETGLNFERPGFDFPIHYPSEPVGIGKKMSLPKLQAVSISCPVSDGTGQQFETFCTRNFATAALTS